MISYNYYQLTSVSIPGQLLAYDIVSTTQPSCPVELLHVPISKEDEMFGKNKSYTDGFPVPRSKYNTNSGKSTNNPRKPVNIAYEHVFYLVLC